MKLIILLFIHFISKNNQGKSIETLIINLYILSNKLLHIENFQNMREHLKKKLAKIIKKFTFLTIIFSFFFFPFFLKKSIIYQLLINIFIIIKFLILNFNRKKKKIEIIIFFSFNKNEKNYSFFSF
jgi:hypothetical protein